MEKPSAISLDFFVSRLKRYNPITFVRYGDGEFNAILGKPGHNCDNHEYFPQLGAELAYTLTHPRTGNYLYAIGPKAVRVMHSEVEAWVDRHAFDIVWNDSEVFLRASLAGELAPLLEVLGHSRVMLLGGAHLQTLALVRRWEFLTAPDTNAWLEKSVLYAQLERALPQKDVLLLCAGMVSKILAWELFRTFGNRVSILDLGSLFDMYVGKDSRSYARRMSFEQKTQLLQANFPLSERKNV